MVNHIRTRTVLACGIAALVWTAPPAMAGVDEGIAAYQAGEYEQALTELEPAARQGDAQAQYYLGSMYAEGQGVLRDPSLAHTWLTLAANQGITEALYAKARIGDSLSQRDIVTSLRRQNEILTASADGGSGQEEVAMASPAAASSNESAPAQTAAVDDIASMGRRELVRNIQQELNRLGYSAGKPDGLYGPSTRSAIEGFQKDRDQSVDGEATADLLRALRSAEAG
ncbi:peptidoglycan-binding protein [Rhodocista pekingensis]|uniref:Peptidoglycan-binding protein n=1 Tax=Rhodocista pekingensis TaxID=201185 RepID=A0ABW2KSI6_9PROT